jgi:hypothetical protein
MERGELYFLATSSLDSLNGLLLLELKPLCASLVSGLSLDSQELLRDLVCPPRVDVLQ